MKRSRPEENENMACEICFVKFSFLRKRRECCECRGECCSSCLVKEQGRNTCKRCRVLLAVPPDPSALMRLKVSDLKKFLCRKHIAHQGCTQKDELVELVLQMTIHSNNRAQARTAPTPTNTTSPSHFSDTRQGSGNASSSFGSTRQASGDQQQQQQQQQQRSPSSSFQASFFTFDSSAPSWQPSNIDTSQENINQTSNCTQPGGKSEEALASLENLANEEAINALSVRQLKLLLLRHFVDYKGCCEKAELQDRVRRLWRQHKESEDVDPDTLSNEQLCKICWEVPINCVLLECGHMATCTECGKRMHECPICRQYVVRVVHTFRA